jgi:hypothetical protein
MPLSLSAAGESSLSAGSSNHPSFQQVHRWPSSAAQILSMISRRDGEDRRDRRTRVAPWSAHTRGSDGSSPSTTVSRCAFSGRRQGTPWGNASRSSSGRPWQQGTPAASSKPMGRSLHRSLIRCVLRGNAAWRAKRYSMMERPLVRPALSCPAGRVGARASRPPQGGNPGGQWSHAFPRASHRGLPSRGGTRGSAIGRTVLIWHGSSWTVRPASL